MTLEETQKLNASIELIHKLYRSEDLLRRYRDWIESYAKKNGIPLPPRSKA